MTFYDDFSAHRIRIAPGDVLRVKLEIRQKKPPGVDVYVNEGYEVIQVVKHIPRPSQEPLGKGTSQIEDEGA
jgi:hypothetical protein